MSRRAPSLTFKEAYWNCSPVIGCSLGSTCTSWHTSVNKVVVKSRMSLCLMEGNPPLGHAKECSIENLAPQGQYRGNHAGSQPYRRATVSWKAVLCKAKPCFCHRRTVANVSQLDAPFQRPTRQSSASSQAHLQVAQL